MPKIWVKERFIEVFRDEILPNAESLKPSYLRKHYFTFWTAMSKTKEITYQELYKMFDKNYEEIIQAPPLWSREKLISYMKELIEKGERVNPTYLSQHHEPFYMAIRRSKEISVAELYQECGLDYTSVKRQKRYTNDAEVTKRLLQFKKDGMELQAKHIRTKEPSIYKYLLEKGNGSLTTGLRKIGVVSK